MPSLVALGATGHLPVIPFVIAANIVGSALKIANTWEKFVILRAGKFRGVKVPGLFHIIPVIDHAAAVIDECIQTKAFSAAETLTKDTVPVNVDAIIFWFVHGAQKAALNITSYREAIDLVSQTLLRERIGSSMLSALLSERNVCRKDEDYSKSFRVGKETPGQSQKVANEGNVQSAVANCCRSASGSRSEIHLADGKQ